MKLSREFYRPRSYMAKVTPKDVPGAEIYLIDDTTVMAFGGKRSKPDIYTNYRTAARRKEAVANIVANYKGDIERAAERRAKRTAFEHSLKVGDFLYSSWGYEMTNIDYYEVTKVIGKKTVEIREVYSTIVKGENDHFAYDNVAPVAGEYKGKPMKKVVREGNIVTIASYANAYPWDGTPKTRTNPMFGH